MLRLTELFVAIGMLLIAGMAAGATYVLGLPRTEAAVVAFAAFTVLVLLHLAKARARDRREAALQIVDLSRGIADLARQIGQLEQRHAALANGTETALQRLSAHNQPLTAEVAELGTIVRQLAEHAGEVVQVSTLGERLAAPSAVAGGNGTAAPELAGGGSQSATDATAELVGVVRQAMQSGAIDTYVQPIVTLPQRKVCAYEAAARLPSVGNASPVPSDVLDAAEDAGLIGELDLLMAFRCVRVARRLNGGHENIAIFCRLARPTLSEREIFGRIADFMEANRALAPQLVFTLPLTSWRALRPREEEALSTLAGFGFRFCLDRVTDLRLDPHELADRSCAYVKAPAALLLDRLGRASGPDAAADLPSELADVGIKLIAEKVEAESTVMDLLDIDVRYAQGGLFSPPRPVRSEVMTGAADPGALPSAVSRTAH
jgi:cyclic-di-GMP phosphodiesterase, flagellum assembly factor TipF